MQANLVPYRSSLSEHPLVNTTHASEIRYNILSISIPFGAVGGSFNDRFGTGLEDKSFGKKKKFAIKPVSLRARPEAEYMSIRMMVS